MTRIRMRSVEWRIACCLAVLLSAYAYSIPASAQTEIIPKEMQALFADISDIDKLRVLHPLKLTAEQLDKITSTLKAVQDAYNAKLTEAAVPPLRLLAKDIKETREKMLATHSGVPKDFDEKVKKLQSDFTKRRDAEDKATIKSLSDSIKAVLTKEQIVTAVSIARKFSEVDGKPTKKGTDDQFFNLYVLGTFIVYPRIVPLLQDMRKAAESAPGQTSSALAGKRAASAESINWRASRAHARQKHTIDAVT